jgi:hypothetical protein
LSEVRKFADRKLALHFGARRKPKKLIFVALMLRNGCGGSILSQWYGLINLTEVAGHLDTD